MRIKRILGAVLVVISIALYLFGNYVSGEVAQGQKKIATAQKGVNQSKRLTNRSPYTKGVGDMAAGSVQKKIDAGKLEAGQYQTLANWLHGGGIVLFIVGAGLIFVSFTGKKRH